MIRLILWLADCHRRLLPLYLVTLGPRNAYAVVAWLASRLLRLQPQTSTKMRAQIRAALGDRPLGMSLDRFCERAFTHQILNLIDLYLADRLLQRGTYRRFGGQLPADELTRLLDAQRRRKPVILVTAYFGPFDLLPLFLGFNGLPVTAVYLAHRNPEFDRQRRAVRARGGCELVTVADAIWRLPQVLEAGGTVAILADHHEQRRGIEIEFLGVKTRISRSIALLAERYEADVVIAGILRRGRFRFEILPIDVVRSEEWAARPDAERPAHITRRYVSALERLVRIDPTQYLWTRPRWGQTQLSEWLNEATDDSTVAGRVGDRAREVQ